MIKTLLLAISAITIIACSSSTDNPPAGFVLGYSSNPVTTSQNQRAFEAFPLKIVNNGVAVKGATAHYTLYFPLSTKSDTVTQLSDVNGSFQIGGKDIAFPLDSMQGVTFYATKDSMKSNTLAWHR